MSGQLNSGNHNNKGTAKKRNKKPKKKIKQKKRRNQIKEQRANLDLENYWDNFLEL